jgi:hypothetical protein
VLIIGTIRFIFKELILFICLVHLSGHKAATGWGALNGAVQGWRLGPRADGFSAI